MHEYEDKEEGRGKIWKERDAKRNLNSISLMELEVREKKTI